LAAFSTREFANPLRAQKRRPHHLLEFQLLRPLHRSHTSDSAGKSAFEKKKDRLGEDPSVDDDPGLDRDDTDGAGPENLNFNIPENTIYRVGVHYWADHEYGPSFATLRVYIYSELVWEQKVLSMNKHDMWDAVRIEWPEATVSEVKAADGGKKITSNYQNPFFFQP
jgi:hypothetical protein